MKVLEAIDALEDELNGARAVPLTDQVRIDKDQIFALIDGLRAAVPYAIKEMRGPESVPPPSGSA